MPFVYPYPRPMVTVDAVVFRTNGDILEVLLIRRKKAPFAGKLALPGGFVEIDEDLEDAAKRELAEETGLLSVGLSQLGAFGRPGRDPRGRTISIAFGGIVPLSGSRVRGGDDADLAAWVPVDGLPDLAFDHDEIIRIGLKWFKKLAIGP